MKQILTTSSFGWADQNLFAQLSGDANPMHLDAVAARRTLFGEPVVHGVHVLLRTLEQWIAARPPAAERAIRLQRLRGRFPNPTSLDRPVEAILLSESGGQVKLSATSDRLCVLHLDLKWDYASELSPRPPPAPNEDNTGREARSLTLDEIEGASGVLPVWLDRNALASEFPELAARLSMRQLAELLACTRLVGMECPGLHSIFSAFDLHGRKPERGDDSFHYRAVKVVPNASLVRLAVQGSGFEGRVDAFRRPESTPLPDMASVSQRVDPREWADQVALVVGGSRGIGAVTAKIIAAGGGRPVVTYHRGESDALELAREIRAAGGRCEVVRCDIAKPGSTLNWLEVQGITPTHLYYFASPKIFVKRSDRGYSRDIYLDFTAAYVDGFVAILLACQERRRRGLTAFYPSSVSVEEKIPNLEEYSDAKRAGEALCREFDAADNPHRIRVARLPRIDTDQTASLIRVPAANALDVMLRELKTLKETGNG